MNKIDYLVQKYSTGNKVTKPERMAQSAVNFFDKLRSAIYGGNWDGGSFGGGGAANNFFQVPVTETQKIIEIIPVTRTFNEAFAEARIKGLPEFTFNGKKYTTELSDNPGWYKAGNNRTEIIGGIPVERERIIEKSETVRW